MPIGGVVVSTRPEHLEDVQAMLAACPGVEMHGADGQGNIVIVLDTRTGEEMEQLMRAINRHPLVLHAGLTYLNMEDVIGDREEAAD